MNNAKKILFLFSYFFLSSFGFSQAKVGKKHIVILYSDNKEVFGTYYFGVFNNTSENQKVEVDLVLPEGTSSFEPREGVLKEEIKLRDNGSLYAEHSFSPGLSLVGLDFKIPYDYSQRKPIRFNLPFELDEMSVATPKASGLILSSEGFEEGLPPMLSSGEYKGLLKSHLPKGSHFEVSLSGLPSSNSFSILLGGGVGFILLFVLLYYFLSSLKSLERFI